jgi:putative transposase
MAEIAVARRGVSIALACRTFGVSETCYRYGPKLKAENEEIADLLVGLTDARKTWGFGLCFLHLRNVKGHSWNHKRVYRIYCELELNLQIKPRKRLKRDKPDALGVPEAPNMTWSIDFMADRLGDGRAFRLLNMLDDFNRKELGITIQHIQPGQPQQNAYIERYNRVRHWARTNGAGNGSLQHEWLDQYIIETIEEAHDHAAQWLWTYNNDCPNMSIGGIAPAMKLKMAT